MIISNQKIKNFLNFAGENLHAPEQKIALTATALAIQPAIDMCNTKVDQETRKVSTARDITKLVAGAITGISIRYLGIAVANKLTKYKPVYDSTKKFITGVEKGCGILVPRKFIGKNVLEKVDADVFDAKLKKYIKAMGTFVATFIMLYTNFSCDAKWTKDWTPYTYKLLFNEDIDKSKRPKKGSVKKSEKPSIKNAFLKKIGVAKNESGVK